MGSGGFFVEDGDDLSVLQAQLEQNGYRVMVYEGDTPMQERQLIADHLALRGGIVLSMKCLDEGVDIPSISHAVILASSQNPRQFVQRRGRVLRFAGEEKRRAYIWDVMAMPLLDAGDQTRALILAEVARAVEFAGYSDNPTVVARLEGMLAEYGLSIGDCMQVEEEVVVSEDPDSKESADVDLVANAIGKAANSEPAHSDLNILALDALALVEEKFVGDINNTTQNQIEMQLYK